MKLLNINLDMRFPKRYFFAKPNLSRRLLILSRKIHQLKPDFICFQEVTDVLLLASLKTLLFHPYSFIVRGLVRVEGGLCTGFDYTRWNFVYKKFYAFTNQGRFFSKEIADRLLRKGILVSIFDHKETGDRVVVVNVHFTANYGHKELEEERKVLQMQLVQLQKLITDKRHIGKVQIVAGDFNADFTSPVLQKWLKNMDIKPVFPADACTVCATVDPLAHLDQARDMQIDNVLCMGQYQQIKGELVFNQKGEWISDHVGMVVKLKLGRG